MQYAMQRNTLMALLLFETNGDFFPKGIKENERGIHQVMYFLQLDPSQDLCEDSRV